MNYTGKLPESLIETINENMMYIPHQEAIERVQQMELYFDMLQECVNTNPNAICKSSLYKEMIQILTEYYESGQWIQDYELDEIGIFPQNLKRGVLSQDSLYDLFNQINDIEM